MVKPVPSSSSWALKMQMKGRTMEELQSPSPQVFLPDSVSQELGPKGGKLFQEILNQQPGACFISFLRTDLLLPGEKGGLQCC